MRYVTYDPIRIEALFEAVQDPGRGATAAFIGTVRRGGEDGPVAQIAYTGYEAMLEREFDRILAEMAAQWPGARVTARHRLGSIPAGEASIAVAAAAAHRADAFAACRYVIEQAKLRLPVWKREIFDDGRAAWRDNAGGREPAAQPAEPDRR